MPASTPHRYPHTRELLARTRLAYVHVRNLLTDAKRDRGARVSGFVAIWLPEETIFLYLLQGELVNATLRDARGSRAVSITHALDRVPAEPEYGEICFQAADEEQLACMHMAQSTPLLRWPSAFDETDPTVLFPYLQSMTFDGMLEIAADDAVNYLVFRNGSVARAFLGAGHHGTVVDRVAKLFSRDRRVGDLTIGRWPCPDGLPVQAPPGLIQAYRDLSTALVQRLVDHGSAGAPMIAEHARQNLVGEHPVLDGFSVSGRPAREPVTDTAALTTGIAAWTREVLWTVIDHEETPETILRELTWDRRHMFQSAGLYDQLPWKVL